MFGLAEGEGDRIHIGEHLHLLFLLVLRQSPLTDGCLFRGAQEDLWAQLKGGDPELHDLKLILADSATNKRKVYPHLPSIQTKVIATSLVFLPFKDRHHDWVQTPGGTVIAKSVLHFGRAL
ncbi:MAG: hypothetical protein D3908_10770 [Candidatus Electrothrix sp. AUS4]|nr:hypothetical protein [Candidatus Electrothrix sp. AUS4]